MSDTTITEYGIQDRHGDVAWPNDEGVLHIPNATGNHAIEADDLEALREALANPRPGVISRQALVQRTVTYGSCTPVPDPLPTTPGSVIQADSLLMLTRFGNWVSDGVFTVTAEELAGEAFTILFDAATVKGD
ncbi:MULTISPECIES: hypothetical protein [unclassified Cryobacterium]|uniref:hypothetical protein n=1 Tax=unclassified Cryobacterium TaxID=2649013 RepID=UPI001069625F|nr:MULTISPECIES: hypothetical protein [unclassified Cryobacterium]TFC59433.1 hypothetical protein E3O68_00605 [Cryobacterium sp. TMB3-1-2]TFC67229.1 hypothetical protein E3T21_17300 [Cryobacterium sp. TMB3-15]TFC73258.1 hypothetical protein E3T22_16755 [Cryobacterium sp. TMB3-10]TFD46146.1 hypothetical protein E3T58_01390 [Cryobacterium sp. TMB3-12]